MLTDTIRRDRLVDELVVAYVDWRESCARVDDAYGFWANEAADGGRIAFALYGAALDAEERAATVYAQIVRRADKVSRSEEPLAKPLGGPRCGGDWP